MYSIKKQSGWDFKTSGGLSVGGTFAGFGQAGGTVGHFVLASPAGGLVRFNYVSAGVGVGASKSVGALGGGVSLESMPSSGEIWMLDSFGGDELSMEDLNGFAMITEASVALLAYTKTLTVMVLGTPLRKVPQELLKEGGALQMALGVAAQHPRVVELAAGFFGQILFDELQPSLVSILRSEAKAVLVMTGDSATNSVGAAGLLGSYGYIWTGDLEAYDVAPTARPDPEFVEIETSMSASDRWSVVRLQGDTLFDFAKWDIKSEAMALLRSLADHIKQKSPKRVQFNGYTDGIGKPHFNYNLSKKRAQAVADWLSSLGALNGCIVQIVPHGMDNPVQPNKLSNGWDNPYGRAMNRRVEIAIFS